jgi:hypothetical protein
LLDEWVPTTRSFTRDDALAELAKRYFTGHGPATLHDFVWWSGLVTADARAGLEMVQSQLSHADVDGQVYWFSPAAPLAADMPFAAYLLPGFDEYLVGYKERNAVLDPAYASRLSALLSSVIVIEGRVVGTWKRTLQKNAVVIEADPFYPFTPAQRQVFAAAAQRYAAFLGVPARLP